DVPADDAHARSAFELTCGPLKAQIELLLLELEDLVLEFVWSHGSYVTDLHIHALYPMRATKRVLIGSLAAASRIASRAVPSSTPSTSNMMRPGFTLHAHHSG